MSRVHESLTPELQQWIAQQHVFFVATAPLGADGHINCSPKGGDTFRVIGPREVAYLDFTGSGIETVAHIRENGRIVIMFCAFSDAPQIVRLHGRGEAIFPGHAEFSTLYRLFPAHPGVRGIIRVRLTRISDSCGYSVPLMRYESSRTLLEQWSEKKGCEALAEYRRTKNRTSIDGLPGVKEA